MKVINKSMKDSQEVLNSNNKIDKIKIE